MPTNTEYEEGSYEWVSEICDIYGYTDSKMVLWVYERTHEKLKQYFAKSTKTFDVVYRLAKSIDVLKVMLKKLKNEDLLAIVKTRKHTVSYYKETGQIPEKLDRLCTDTNIEVVYPEQEIKYEDAMDVQV